MLAAARAPFGRIASSLKPALECARCAVPEVDASNLASCSNRSFKDARATAGDMPG